MLFNHLTKLVTQGNFMKHPVTCMTCYFVPTSVIMVRTVKKSSNLIFFTKLVLLSKKSI